MYFNLFLCKCLGAVSALGKEQFLAMYMSGGMVSAFTSYLYKAALKRPNPSLGAVSRFVNHQRYLSHLHLNVCCLLGDEEHTVTYLLCKDNIQPTPN